MPLPHRGILWAPLAVLALMAIVAGVRAADATPPPAAAPPALTQTQTQAEAELREIKEVLWPRAYREGDVALLDRLLAAEFRLIDPNGEWSDKENELAHVARSRWINRAFRFEIRRLEVFENGTAVVAGRGVVIGPQSAPESGYHYQSSNVLIRRDGRWQAIASHVSGVRDLTPEELAAAEAALAAGPQARAGLVDHHVHLLGPDLLRDWKSLGVTFSRADEAYLSPAGLLDAASTTAHRPVDGVALISMAHLYGRSGFRTEMNLSLEEEQARVARENDHVVQQAVRWPRRAVAFCSVAVLRPYALAELDRCHERHATAGVKLHVAASDLDLRESAHLDTIGGVLARAEQRGQTVLLHVDPQRRGHEAADIARFARAVLEPRRDLTIVVAHLGGSGGYGPWTREVFSTLLDWLDERAAAGDARSRVFFDLSAVLLERESEGVPATTPEEAEALARDLRRAGLGRIVLGSDYPVFDPHRTLELLAERAGITPQEIDRMVENRAFAFP